METVTFKGTRRGKVMQMKVEIPIPDYTYHKILMLDTKVNILASFEALDIHVAKSLKKVELAENPGTQEWKATLEDLTTLQQQIEHDVKFNPMILPIQQLPQYIQRLMDELKSFDNIEKRLKRLEPQISKYNIDFNCIPVSNAKQSCNLCRCLNGDDLK